MDLGPVVSVVPAILVFTGLLVFRGEVKKLVNWVVGFKKLAKTSEGYAVESASTPEPAPALAILSDKQKVVDAEQEIEEHKELLPSEASTTDPNHWIALVSNKRYAEALEDLSRQLKGTADLEERTRVRAFIGHARYEQNATDGIAYFEDLVKELPDSPFVYVWYGLGFYWDDQPVEALKILDRGLAHIPDSASLRSVKAEVLGRIGREDEAADLLRSAIAIDPSNTSQFLSLGNLLAKTNSSAALEVLRDGLSRHPTNEALLARYADLQAKAGHNAQAALWYYFLLSRVPDNPRYHALLGNVLLTLELNDHAMEEYRKANEAANAGQAWIVANIGNLYKNRGLYSEGERHLKRALELDPHSSYAHERLAESMKLRGEEAVKLRDLLADARKSEASSPNTLAVPLPEDV